MQGRNGTRLGNWLVDRSVGDGFVLLQANPDGIGEVRMRGGAR